MNNAVILHENGGMVKFHYHFLLVASLLHITSIYPTGGRDVLVPHAAQPAKRPLMDITNRKLPSSPTKHAATSAYSDSDGEADEATQHRRALSDLFGLLKRANDIIFKLQAAKTPPRDILPRLLRGLGTNEDELTNNLDHYVQLTQSTPQRRAQEYLTRIRGVLCGQIQDITPAAEESVPISPARPRLAKTARSPRTPRQHQLSVDVVRGMPMIAQAITVLDSALGEPQSPCVDVRHVREGSVAGKHKFTGLHYCARKEQFERKVLTPSKEQRVPVIRNNITGVVMGLCERSGRYKISTFFDAGVQRRFEFYLNEVIEPCYADAAYWIAVKNTGKNNMTLTRDPRTGICMEMATESNNGDMVVASVYPILSCTQFNPSARILTLLDGTVINAADIRTNPTEAIAYPPAQIMSDVHHGVVNQPHLQNFVKYIDTYRRTVVVDMAAFYRYNHRPVRVPMGLYVSFTFDDFAGWHNLTDKLGISGYLTWTLTP